MPYKNSEKQNEYLRRWRERKQRVRLQKEKEISILFFSLYFSENLKKDRRRVRWLCYLVFDRVLEREELEVLLGYFESLPQKFLEALLVCWRERSYREITVSQFISEIFLAPDWTPCPTCGRPYLEAEE